MNLCSFGFHKWTIWFDLSRKVGELENGRPAANIIQERTCKRCKKNELREQRAG